MRLGVHASVRGGFGAALEEALALGCESLQILPYRRHIQPSPEELSSFAAARSAAKLQLLVHSRFVPSLASSDSVRRNRSIKHLANELILTTALGGDAYVIHGGAYSPDSSLETGVKLFAQSVIMAVQQSACRTPLLLENVPGGGRRMGGSLEDLARLQDALKPSLPDVGVCLDTAHAYAAGYDCSTAEGSLSFLARAHRLLGFDAVKAFHLNDTRALLSSHREHHEHWGRGRLGGEGLKALLDREEFSSAPAILETPKDFPGADRANLEFARGLSRP
ncbi:MAG: deoxyribonuclease IV [Elusimicrobia bacterium]|nr:deoxyribonuclease IV [Elusimicrobiota bacterium]